MSIQKCVIPLNYKTGILGYSKMIIECSCNFHGQNTGLVDQKMHFQIYMYYCEQSER